MEQEKFSTELASPSLLGVKRQAKFYPFDLVFALNYAADFLEAEEWPEDDGGNQMAAYKEAAKRIRRMSKRIVV